ncbi:MAG: protein translocase SEC61 complex subunit gamma [Euryarchaeota archaeon]|nr:protein translocase SEC61 complex subunit gamma [Euryarchaeota archaeon]
MATGLVEKSWEIQKRIEERAKRLGKGKYGRVLQMARKPTAEEYNRIVQIVALGLLILGAVGFGIYLLFQVVGPYVASLFG